MPAKNPRKQPKKSINFAKETPLIIKLYKPQEKSVTPKQPLNYQFDVDDSVKCGGCFEP